MSDETIGRMSAAIFIATLLAIVITFLGGCATVTKKVTGPNGYGYTESITAFGGGNIEKAAQSFGGTLKVYNPDGTPLVDVVLKSEQESEGMTRDIQAILAGMEFFKTLGTMMAPVP